MEKPKVLSLSPLPTGVIQMYIAPYLSGKEVEIIAMEKYEEEKFKEIIKEVDVLLGDFSFNIPINREMLKDAKKLKLVQQPTVGYQHIDTEGIAKLNIPVANTAGANDISVAEHTIMMALALLKKLFYTHQRTQGGDWVQVEMFSLGVFELYDKVWGIVGCGRIGREVIKRILPFGVKVQYYDKFRLDETKEQDLNITYVPFDKLLRTSDIISLHLPLTGETKHLLDEKRLSLIKPHAIVINVARGELIDELSLSQKLKQKAIAGAAVDVFSQEPVEKDNPLLSCPNVILTPHIAGATNEARGRIIKKAIENVIRVLEGQKPVDVVNGVV